MRAHHQARQQFELWAHQECITVDACAAFLESQSLSDSLLQLRLQYDTCVPGITSLARTMQQHAVSMYTFSRAVDRCYLTGMLHDSDKEAYDAICIDNFKRVAMHSAPPRVMASCLISLASSRSERIMLRWWPVRHLLM
jgi:hypothetical protein